jgi:hypothetical protein
MGIVFSLLISFFFSCGTTEYGTFKYRDSQFQQTDLSISPDGLSKGQIEAILSTTFPNELPVSISIMFLTKSRFDNDPTQLISYFINEIKTIPWIERIVPIPKILIPNKISFDAIQELGIRSLSEYTLLFYGDTYDVFTWEKTSQGKYVVKSTLEFMLIDNQTTAIIASEKLISSEETKFQIFGESERKESLKLIFKQQALVLKDKLFLLFKQSL